MDFSLLVRLLTALKGNGRYWGWIRTVEVEPFRACDNGSPALLIVGYTQYRDEMDITCLYAY
jgi:hypothetical protein